MDPRATLVLIAEHLRDDDIDAATEAARDYAEWKGRGGYRPACGWRALSRELKAQGWVAYSPPEGWAVTLGDDCPAPLAVIARELVADRRACRARRQQESSRSRRPGAPASFDPLH